MSSYRATALKRSKLQREEKKNTRKKYGKKNEIINRCYHLVAIELLGKIFWLANQHFMEIRLEKMGCENSFSFAANFDWHSSKNNCIYLCFFLIFVEMRRSLDETLCMSYEVWSVGPLWENVRILFLRILLFPVVHEKIAPTQILEVTFSPHTFYIEF